MSKIPFEVLNTYFSYVPRSETFNITQPKIIR